MAFLPESPAFIAVRNAHLAAMALLPKQGDRVTINATGQAGIVSSITGSVHCNPYLVTDEAGKLLGAFHSHQITKQA